MIETESEILVREISRLKKLNKIIKTVLFLFLLIILISGIIFILHTGDPALENNQTASFGTNVRGGFKI